MKVINYFALVALIVLPAVSASTVAKAENDMSMAIVSVERLMNESKAAKHIKDQQKEIIKSNEKALSSLVEKAKDLEKKLSKAMKDKDEATFKKHREVYNAQLQDIKKKEVELQQKSSKSLQAALKKLTDKIMGLVDAHAEKQDFDLVLTTNNIAYARDAMNITPTIMDELNNALPKIKLK